MRKIITAILFLTASSAAFSADCNGGVGWAERKLITAQNKAFEAKIQKLPVQEKNINKDSIIEVTVLHIKEHGAAGRPVEERGQRENLFLTEKSYCTGNMLSNEYLLLPAECLQIPQGALGPEYHMMLVTYKNPFKGGVFDLPIMYNSNYENITAKDDYKKLIPSKQGYIYDIDFKMNDSFAAFKISSGAMFEIQNIDAAPAAKPAPMNAVNSKVNLDLLAKAAEELLVIANYKNRFYITKDFRLSAAQNMLSSDAKPVKRLGTPLFYKGALVGVNVADENSAPKFRTLNSLADLFK